MGKQNKPLIRQATKSLADTAENKGLYCFSLQFLFPTHPFVPNAITAEFRCQQK